MDIDIEKEILELAKERGVVDPEIMHRVPLVVDALVYLIQGRDGKRYWVIGMQ